MNRDRFSEELFEAITDIDDFLITEAENELLSESSNTVPQEATGNLKVISAAKPRNRYLMLAACFAFIVVVSIPIISLMNGEFGGFATKDEASAEIADEESFGMFDNDNNGAAEDSVVNNISDSLNSENAERTTARLNVQCMTEEFNGFTIHTNYYYGYILDDPAKDPQEVLSLMRVTEIHEKSYYIVVVRDARVKVYDAKTLEPLVDNEGSSVEDVALELDIAG